VKVTRPGGWLLVLVWLASAPWAAAQTFNIGANFKTMDLETSNSLGRPLEPPDTMGAVGMQHFIAFNNGSFSIYNKNGTLVSQVSDTSFWTTALGANPGGGGDLTDVRVLYDPRSQRWFTSMITFDPNNSAQVNNNILIARSNTSNPTQGFKAVSFTTTNGLFADYPTLGLDANGIYIGTNNFTSAGGNFSGVGMYSVPKTDLIANTPTLTHLTNNGTLDASIYGFTLQAAVNYGPKLATDPTPILAHNSDFFSEYNFTPLSGTTAPGATLGATVVRSVLTTSTPTRSRQPGTSVTLDNDDVRFAANVVQVGNFLYGVHGVTGNGGRSAVRWTIADATTFAIVQQGTISDSNLSYFYPAIGVNTSGDVVVAFSGSNSTTFASTYAVVGSSAGGVAGGSLTFGTPIQTKAGTAAYTFSRWGDYSAVTPDPTDPGIFWAHQEYADTPGPSFASNWATQATEIIATKTGEVRWKTAANGNFTNGTQWFNGSAPGLTSHAIYSREGTPYTVTFPAGSTTNDRASVRQGTVTFNIPSGGSYALTNGTTATPSLSIAEFQGIASLTVSGGGALQTAHTMLAGTDGGSGTLTVTGALTSWTNSGNVFVGGTSTTAGGTGTINVTAGASATVGGTMTLWNPSSTATVNAGTLSVAGLSNPAATNPTVTLTDPGTGAALTVTHGQNTTYSGTIAGTGSVVKSGSGAWTLAGANTYSGGTTVSGGTLRAANTSGSATGSGPVTVQAAGTLAGTGTIVPDTGVPANNHVSIAGNVQPGSDTATGYLTLGSNSAPARVDITGNYTWSLSNSGPSSSSQGGSDTNNPNNQSRLVVNGDVTMMPTSFTVVGLSGLSFDNTQPYSWRVATGTGVVTRSGPQPTFSTTGLNTGGGSFSLSGGLTGIFLSFAPVPEPLAILGVCMLAAGMAQVARRFPIRARTI
jgi:autotransporter-associated beta strand protein